MLEVGVLIELLVDTFAALDEVVEEVIAAAVLGVTDVGVLLVVDDETIVLEDFTAFVADCVLDV